MYEIQTPSTRLDQLREVIGAERAARLDDCAREVVGSLGSRRVWNVNATPSGGGVAEMLAMLVPYGKALGADVRWLVLDGDDGFFAITKRLHNRLHGAIGDGGGLGEAERRHYLEVLRDNASGLEDRLAPGDLVILHDPQTAGLAPMLGAAGVPCLWRCHIGMDEASSLADEAWSFLRPDLELCPMVFTRPSYVPRWVPPGRATIEMPCIDPLSPKNRPLSDAVAAGVVGWLGLSSSGADPAGVVLIHRPDLVSEGPPPPPDAPMVVQVSRWDELKDMEGVMRGFAEHVVPVAPPAAHLALVGPRAEGVADDPESAAVWARCKEVWSGLPPEARRRIRLLALPMVDGAENATMVNAIQQRATIVVQKSLVEGFGLTVAEAMWKGRPVVVSAVGGIVDQVDDGVEGLLVEDPHDLGRFGACVVELLADPGRARRMGEQGRAKVLDEFLPDRSLMDWGRRVTSLVAGARGAAAPGAASAGGGVGP